MDEQRANAVLRQLLEVQGDLNGVDAEPALKDLDGRHGDLIKAFTWFLDHGDAVSTLRFAGGLRVYLVDRGHVDVGRGLVDRALALEGAQERSAHRAHALVAGANLAFRQGDNTVARELFDEAVAISRELGDHEAEARALSGLSRVEMRAGDYEAVRERARESISIWERLGDDAGLAGAFHMLAYVNLGEQNYEEARKLFRESLDNARRLDYRAYIAVESGNLAAVERELGNLDQAEALTRESLAMAFELESAYMIPYALADLGGLAGERGSHEHGARLLGAADAAFARAGVVMDPGAEPTFRRDVERTREVLGERFESAWQGGRRLSTEDAVRIALVPPP